MSISVTGPNGPLTRVEQALKESLSPTDIRDVVFYAFSCRTISSDGIARVTRPLPIIAIGSILKGTEHFSKLYSEASGRGESDHVIRQSAHAGEYDYDSDSDLDEFEEPDPPEDPPEPEDSDPEDRPPAVAAVSSNPVRTQHKKDDALSVAENTLGTSGRHQFLIPNIAYRTLRACIFYLYTGKISFLPLASRGAAGRQFAMLTAECLSAPPCSPRSLYRLAESYGITELQELAYTEITSQLNPTIIVKEAFSSFFARYDRLREHAVSYLSQNYSDTAVQESLQAVIERVVRGELLHAGGVLRSLLGLRVAVVPPTPAAGPGRSLPTPSAFRFPQFAATPEAPSHSTLTVPTFGVTPISTSKFSFWAPSAESHPRSEKPQ